MVLFNYYINVWYNQTMNELNLNVLNQLLFGWGIYSILFFAIFLIWLAYIIRLWLVQTAMFQIQTDLAEIKDKLLEASDNDKTSMGTAVQEEDESVSVSDKNKFKFKKPRLVFLWIAATIPLLFIAFVIIYISTH